MDVIEKRRRNEKEALEKYNEDLKRVKKIINTQFKNENCFFVFDFLKTHLFSRNNTLDLNPQMLAYNQGKEAFFNFFVSLLDNETIIEYLTRKGEK